MPPIESLYSVEQCTWRLPTANCTVQVFDVRWVTEDGHLKCCTACRTYEEPCRMASVISQRPDCKGRPTIVSAYVGRDYFSLFDGIRLS